MSKKVSAPFPSELVQMDLFSYPLKEKYTYKLLFQADQDWALIFRLQVVQIQDGKRVI